MLMLALLVFLSLLLHVALVIWVLGETKKINDNHLAAVEKINSDHWDSVVAERNKLDAEWRRLAEERRKTFP